MRHVALSTNQYAGYQIFKLKLQNNKNGYENLTHACEWDGALESETEHAPTKGF